jgi:hypothetical protein
VSFVLNSSVFRSLELIEKFHGGEASSFGGGVEGKDFDGVFVADLEVGDELLGGIGGAFFIRPGVGKAWCFGELATHGKAATKDGSTALVLNTGDEAGVGGGVAHSGEGERFETPRRKRGGRISEDVVGAALAVLGGAANVDACGAGEMIVAFFVLEEIGAGWIRAEVGLDAYGQGFLDFR